MASIDTAVEYVLRQEDRKLSGVITTDAGGRTRFGVAEKFHPQLTSTGFYDTMPIAQALDIADNIYSSDYAVQCKIGQIDSQAIANSLLSYAINSGISTSIRLLQRALGLKEDGVMGPITLSKINSSVPQNLLIAWKNVMYAFYQDVVARNSAQSRYFNGWTNRVDENTKQV